MFTILFSGFIFNSLLLEYRKEERNKNQEIRREEPNVFQIILAFNLTSFILICECLKGKELHGILRLYLSKPCVFTVSPIE